MGACGGQQSCGASLLLPPQQEAVLEHFERKPASTLPRAEVIAAMADWAHGSQPWAGIGGIMIQVRCVQRYLVAVSRTARDQLRAVSHTAYLAHPARKFLAGQRECWPVARVTRSLHRGFPPCGGEVPALCVRAPDPVPPLPRWLCEADPGPREVVVSGEHSRQNNITPPGDHWCRIQMGLRHPEQHTSVCSAHTLQRGTVCCRS
jgi:hypothetical protein